MNPEIAKKWSQLHGDFFAGRRVLVTGGAGFIGSHLAEALVALGAAVTVLDDLSGGSRENLASISPVTFAEGSILDFAMVEKLTRGCEYVFHLAALGSVPRSVEQPKLFQDVNASGTLNILEAARAAGVARVMFAASSSAYGLNPVPWVESMPVLPLSPYAATKVAGEALLRAYSNSYRLDTVALRYFNIFGPRQNANSAYAAVIAAFAKSYLAGSQPIIFGNGEQSRDFTFVANAVHANLLAARSSRWMGGEVVNVGCGGRISVNHLAVSMAQELGRPDLTAIHKAARAGDILHSFADLNKARGLLDYQPIVSYEAGLRETLAWYRSVLGIRYSA